MTHYNLLSCAPCKIFTPESVKRLYLKLVAIAKNTSYLANPRLRRALAVQTHLTREELACITEFSKSLPYKANGVEIGSYLGASALATCAGFRTNSGTLYCVDTWMNDAMAYTDDEINNPDLQPQDTFSEFKHNLSLCSDCIVPLRGWSQDVFPRLKEIGIKLDWLFIDGDHSYEGVKLDWDLYSNILKPGAIVIFHDTGWAEGVKQLIRESVIRYCSLSRKLPNMQVFCYHGENI